MPACDARYDVTLSDGYSTWNGFGRPRTRAVLDFNEERMPDDFGEPGALLAARLATYWTDNGRVIGYHKRRLLVDGDPVHTDAKHRRYLRWKWFEPDPPAHYDPEWVSPP